MIQNVYAKYLIREKTGLILSICGTFLAILLTTFFIWGAYNNLAIEDLMTLKIVLGTLIFIVWILQIVSNSIKLSNIISLEKNPFGIKAFNKAKNTYNYIKGRIYGGVSSVGRINKRKIKPI